MTKLNFTRAPYCGQLLFAFALTFLAMTTLVPGQAETTDRPNIIIIFTDDQGYADVGVYGAQGFATPHLDRMAQEGRRFTNF